MQQVTMGLRGATGHAQGVGMPRAGGGGAPPRGGRVALATLFALVGMCAGCGGDATPTPTPDVGVNVCSAHADCDDGVFCNGDEQCMPGSPAANADGCVAGAPACPANIMCDESESSCGTTCSNPDMDRDGHDAVACGGDDCDDTDADRFPGNPETCDDGAGGQHDEDCDPTTFGTTDRDGDGEVAATCCNTGPNGPNCGTDCDDTTIRRRSGQVEFCDGVDNDCDARVDEETQDVPWYPDGDGDGFGSGTTPAISCTPVPDHSLASTDCDDSDAQQHPGQLDICDLSDNNCNSSVDELPICDVVQLVGAAGATLTTTATGGGTITVQVPPGALSATTPLAIGEIHPRTLPRLDAGQSFVGRPVSITPYEQDFAVPVNVSLPAAGPNLAVLWLSDEDDETWELVSATFVVGQARFGAQSSGIYAVVTKTCTPSNETCDGVDNDCDWLVDEGNVCSGPPDMGVDAGRDMGNPWGTTCSDAGVPVIYRLGALNIPTPQQANSGAIVGHNLDGVGTTCSVPDYSGGIDNTFMDLAGALPALSPADPIDFQGEIDAGLACDALDPTCLRLDLMVRIAVGTGCVTVRIEDGAGTTLMSTVAGSLDGSGNFRVVANELNLPIPMRTSSGTISWVLSLSSVVITGTLTASDVTNVIIGGVLLKADLESTFMSLLPLLDGSTSFSGVAPILADLYDVQVAGQCTGLSAGFLATGAATVP